VGCRFLGNALFTAGENQGALATTTSVDFALNRVLASAASVMQTQRQNTDTTTEITSSFILHLHYTALVVQFALINLDALLLLESNNRCPNASHRTAKVW